MLSWFDTFCFYSLAMKKAMEEPSRAQHLHSIVHCLFRLGFIAWSSIGYWEILITLRVSRDNSAASIECQLNFKSLSMVHCLISLAFFTSFVVLPL